MNQERLQLKGMLAESKKKYRELDTEASGLILIIRTLLNPYVEIESIDTEKCIDCGACALKCPKKIIL